MAANFSSGVACLDSRMPRRRSFCCSTRSMATLTTLAAETEVLLGDDIGYDRSTVMVERIYILPIPQGWTVINVAPVGRRSSPFHTRRHGRE